MDSDEEVEDKDAPSKSKIRGKESSQSSSKASAWVGQSTGNLKAET